MTCVYKVKPTLNCKIIKQHYYMWNGKGKMLVAHIHHMVQIERSEWCKIQFVQGKRNKSRRKLVSRLAAHIKTAG